MFKKIILILIILFIVFAGVFVYQWWQAQKELPEQKETETLKTSEESNWETYRNEEFGFEFQYPEKWTFEVNSFYSPSSKFNLQGNSSAEDYNSLVPHFLINIVTPDFADRQFSDLMDIASEISIGKVVGIKYEYETQYGSYKVSNITIILPLGQYKMILRMQKEHENIFNQILASFKLLDNLQ